MARQSPKNDPTAQTPAKLADDRQIARSAPSGQIFGCASKWRARRTASPSSFRLGLTCFAIASAAAIDGSLTRQARADEPLTECRIHIGLSSYAPQDCMLGGDGTNLRITWPHSAARTYWVILKVSPGGITAEASWNDFGADAEKRKPLGTLNRADECWESETVSVCFLPKDEAQRSTELYGEEAQPLDDRLAGIGDGRSVTCVATEEDLYSPSARAMNWARAGESTKFTLKTPRQWQFQRMQGSVSVNGKAVAP